MREMSRSLPGIGLIFGAALGFGVGLILDQGSAAIAGAVPSVPGSASSSGRRSRPSIAPDRGPEATTERGPNGVQPPSGPLVRLSCNTRRSGMRPW